MARNKKNGTASTDQDVRILEKKWLNMKSYGSFIVTQDEVDHKFDKGDTTIILPSDRPPGTEIEVWEHWVGIIKDIRADVDADGTNTVYAKVQWYYSGKDVADVIKSFDANAVGHFERMTSEHMDFVESQAFEDVVSVINFNENDPEPQFIPRDQFYRRYHFEYTARTVKPKPGSKGCLCQKPYNPNDKQPQNVMHFCPRPSCRRAYHQRCLLAGKHKDSSSTNIVSNPLATPKKPGAARSARKHAAPLKKKPKSTSSSTTIAPASRFSRDMRLLACSPDTDDVVDLESLIPLTVIQVSQNKDDDDSDVYNHPPPKKRKGHPNRTLKSTGTTLTKSEAVVQPPRSLAEALAELPPLLLQVAQQPMVRGYAFEKGGVSGNVGFVTRARRLVYQILEGGVLSDDWEDELFGWVSDKPLGVDNAIVEIKGSNKALPPVICPNCLSAI